jgi:hypothetical protein
MKISLQIVAISILALTLLAFWAQEAVPYANSEGKVEWVRGTNFSKYKTYAWDFRTRRLLTPNHSLDDIDAALKAKVYKKWD